MKTFSALLALCAGNSPVTGEFPSQRLVLLSLDVFFDLCLNKWLSKQSRHWWFEMPSHSLWHPCNDRFKSWTEIYLLFWHISKQKIEKVKPAMEKEIHSTTFYCLFWVFGEILTVLLPHCTVFHSTHANLPLESISSTKFLSVYWVTPCCLMWD